MQSTMSVTVPQTLAHTLQDSAVYPLWQYIITPPSTASSPVLKDSSNVINEFRITPAPAPQSPLAKPLAGRGKAIRSKRSRAKNEIVGNPVKASLSSPKKRSRQPKLTVNTSTAVPGIVPPAIVPPSIVPCQAQKCAFKSSRPDTLEKLGPWFLHVRNNPQCLSPGDFLNSVAHTDTPPFKFPYAIWGVIRRMGGMDDQSILDSVCWTIAAYPDRFVGLDAIHLNVGQSRPDLTLERLVGILHTSSVIAKVVKGADGMYHMHGLIPVRPDQEVFYAYWHFVDRAIGNHYRYNTAVHIRKEMRRMTGLAVFDSWD